MQRARGSAPIHPNRGHVEMRDLPERSGSGARDLPHALLLLVLRLLPTPLLHIMQGGINGFNGLLRRRRQNERRDRHDGDNKRNRSNNLDSVIRWQHR